MIDAHGGQVLVESIRLNVSADGCFRIRLLKSALLMIYALGLICGYWVSFLTKHIDVALSMLDNYEIIFYHWNTQYK